MGLSLYGDPDELDRLATQLSARAQIVRQHADDQVRRAQAAHWVSTAAQGYRDTVARDRVAADQAASEVEQAAAALHAHAQQVREKLAQISRYEHEATAWFEGQAKSLSHDGESLVGDADRLVKKAVEPPWQGWPFGPGNLPGAGDMRWLEVGHFMHGHGVL